MAPPVPELDELAIMAPPVLEPPPPSERFWVQAGVSARTNAATSSTRRKGLGTGPNQRKIDEPPEDPREAATGGSFSAGGGEGSQGDGSLGVQAARANGRESMGRASTG